MKTKIFFFLIVFLNSFFVNGQNDFKTEINKLLNLIAKNITPDANKNSSEYFIYDITLNISGAITEINLLSHESSEYENQAKKLIESLKNNWTPVKSTYLKIFIPVFILHEGNSEYPEDSKKITKVASFFKTLHKKSFSKDVYFTRELIITVFR